MPAQNGACIEASGNGDEARAHGVIILLAFGWTFLSLPISTPHLENMVPDHCPTTQQSDNGFSVTHSLPNSLTV